MVFFLVWYDPEKPLWGASIKYCIVLYCILHLIGHRTINIAEVNLSVPGFPTRTVVALYTNHCKFIGNNAKSQKLRKKSFLEYCSV